MEKDKKKNLFLGIIFDLIGMISYVFPPIDIIWAPLSAYIMIKMYKGSVGKIGGLISFVEEAIPGLDFFPSFTLVWLYVYIVKLGQKAKVKNKNLDVRCLVKRE